MGTAEPRKDLRPGLGRRALSPAGLPLQPVASSVFQGGVSEGTSLDRQFWEREREWRIPESSPRGRGRKVTMLRADTSQCQGTLYLSQAKLAHPQRQGVEVWRTVPASSTNKVSKR